MSSQLPWSTSLYDCCSKCGTCCFGCFCTACLFGSNSHRLNKSNRCLMCMLYYFLGFFCLCWIPHYLQRQSLRRKYNLKEEPCSDVCVTLFCTPCALCQENREMKTREKQPTVTYQGRKNEKVVIQEPAATNRVERF